MSVTEHATTASTSCANSGYRSADAVRAAYVTVRRRLTPCKDYGESPLPEWDGGKDTFGRKRPPIWPKVACHMNDLGVHPLDFIWAQFVARSSHLIPQPNDLLADAAVEVYKAFQIRINPIVRILEVEQRSIATEVVLLTSNLSWTYGRALKHVLLNPHLFPASPLYRCCLATKESLDEVAGRFRSDAVWQYAVEPLKYDAVWADFIPPIVRRNADVFRSQFALSSTNGRNA